MLIGVYDTVTVTVTVVVVVVDGRLRFEPLTLTYTIAVAVNAHGTSDTWTRPTWALRCGVRVVLDGMWTVTVAGLRLTSGGRIRNLHCLTLWVLLLL